MNENITIKRLGNIYGDKHGTGHAGNVWSTKDICPTLNTAQGGNRMPLIVEDFYSNRDIRVYDKYSPSLRSERNGLKVIENDKS